MNEDSILRDWRNTRFLNIPCSQMAIDFIVWEHILGKYCQGNGRILELGTLRAGFSLFLCLQAIQRGMAFKTFDNYNFNAQLKATQGNTKDPYGFNTPLGQLLMKDAFVSEDVLYNGTTVLALIAQPGQTILYCDNGLKPKEVQLYAPHLKSGDLLAVHDWGTEIYPADIPAILTQIEADMTDSLRSMTAFFIKP